MRKYSNYLLRVVEQIIQRILNGQPDDPPTQSEFIHLLPKYNCVITNRCTGGVKIPFKVRTSRSIHSSPALSLDDFLCHTRSVHLYISSGSGGQRLCSSGHLI